VALGRGSRGLILGLGRGDGGGYVIVEEETDLGGQKGTRAGAVRAPFEGKAGVVKILNEGLRKGETEIRQAENNGNGRRQTIYAHSSDRHEEKEKGRGGQPGKKTIVQTGDRMCAKGRRRAGKKWKNRGSL